MKSECIFRDTFGNNTQVILFFKFSIYQFVYKLSISVDTDKSLTSSILFLNPGHQRICRPIIICWQFPYFFRPSRKSLCEDQ